MAKILYHAVPGDWRKEQKYQFLEKTGSVAGVKWEKLSPDEKGNWITNDTDEEFDTFLPIASKEAKAGTSVPTIFRTYSLGVSTNRDAVVYDFDAKRLAKRVEEFIDDYNSEVERWKKKGRPQNVDDFLKSDRVKWSRDLKLKLTREQIFRFDRNHIRSAIYRPFTTMHLYCAEGVVDRIGPAFELPAKSKRAVSIVVGAYNRKAFSVLATDGLPNLNFYADPALIFSLSTCSSGGMEWRDNITPKALTLFQIFYDDNGLTRADIFHYVYALLHHPAYRTRYAENLKRELPRIPFIGRSGRMPGIAPRHPPTPPDERFSASGGWSVQRSSFPGTQSGDIEHSDKLGAFSLRPVVGQSGVATAVVTPRCFVRCLAARSSATVGSVRSFGPSHRDAFLFVRPSSATMASADFPPPLSGGISPGQRRFCPLAPLGSTACRQWLLGFVFASTLAPDIRPRCPFVFLRSSVGLPPFRAGSLRRRPGGSATVGATSPRREPFIPQEQTPAGHTSGGLATAAISATSKKSIGGALPSAATAGFFPLSAVEKMQGDAKPEHNPKASAKLFHAFAAAGKKLADLHVNYESAKEFPLQRQENNEVKLDWRVEAMKLIKPGLSPSPVLRTPSPPAGERDGVRGRGTTETFAIRYNDFLTLEGIPPEALDYRLGNRSALEWVAMKAHGARIRGVTPPQEWRASKAGDTFAASASRFQSRPPTPKEIP